MYRIIPAVCVSIILFSCSKNSEEMDKESPHVISEITTKSVDPVIDHYSEYGSIVEAPLGYVARLDACDNHDGLYLFVPNAGPFSGIEIEVYRYHNYEDMGPCGDEFTEKQFEKQTAGGYTYIACPEKGNNCQIVQDNLGCMLVFCDDVGL